MHFVRTLGQKTHDDQEFEKHLSKPVTRQKIQAFRLMTCLMGMVKLLIFRQPFLKPDLALAQKLWDEWDNIVDLKYGLPKPSPRKNIKRLENLITMCTLNAVAHVFVYRQTACMFDAGKTDAEYPKGKPFKLSMLYECIQMLQPTREMIHQGWCMGLEYSIGTSSMGLNTLTVVAETIGMSVGSLFAMPPSDYSGHMLDDKDVTQIQASHEASRKDPGSGGAVPFVPPDTTKEAIEGFTPFFSTEDSLLKPDELERSREIDRIRREARIKYQYRCSRNALGTTSMKDIASLADDCLSDCVGQMSLSPRHVRKPAPAVEAPMPQAGPVEENGSEDGEPMDAEATRRTPGEGPPGLDEFEKTPSEVDAEFNGEDLGARFWNVHGKEPGELSPGDRSVWFGYHSARSIDHPGSANCCIPHAKIVDEMQKCPYCCTDIEEETPVGDAAGVAEYLSQSSSVLWPTLLELGMFYKPQTIVQWAAGRSAFVEGCNVLGTRAIGSTFTYKNKTNGVTGASRVDTAWLQAKGEQWKSWNKAADYIRNRGNLTCMEFDFHPDGLRDCLYMCSTRDNARRCPEEPRLPANMRPEKCLVNSQNGPVTEHTVVVKVAGYKIPGSDKQTGKEHVHKPRHPDSGVKDTKFQRRVDSMLHGGRLSALNVLMSTRVTSVAPIRMHHDGLEVNIGGIFNHVSLVAEMIKACACVPGLKNMQEAFCNQQSGPEGLSAPKVQKRAVAVVDVTGQDEERDEGEEGEGASSLASSGQKRGRDDVPKEPEVQGLHTLPYSYDIVGIGLAMDTAAMLYDDMGEKCLANTIKKYGDKYGFFMTFNELPHLSTRFIGYDEYNRQTLSLKIGSTRPKGQLIVQAGDPDVSDSRIDREHVERSLARPVTDDDVAQYISRRQGARSMGGVTGDLFASSTWFNHSLATLKQRGLITGNIGKEPAARAFMDMEQCIQARVVEHACVRQDARYIKLGLQKATPQTYTAKENRAKDEETAVGNGSRQGRRREVNKHTHTNDDLVAGLSDDDEPAPVDVQRGRPQPIGLGAGPVDD